MSQKIVHFGNAQLLTGPALARYNAMSVAEKFEATGKNNGAACFVSEARDFDGDERTEYLMAHRFDFEISLLIAGVKTTTKRKMMSKCRQGFSHEMGDFGGGDFWFKTKYGTPGSDLMKLADSGNVSSRNFVTEVRYGDYDKDDDIDVAVKIDSGAVYLFSNLTK